MQLSLEHLWISPGCSSGDSKLWLQQHTVPVSELESDFPGRIRALGQREVTEGRRGGPHACTVLEAPVANAFPFVTQSHVRQGKENCYYRVLLHLNHAIFNQDKRKPSWLISQWGCLLCHARCWNRFMWSKPLKASGACRHIRCFKFGTA